MKWFIKKKKEERRVPAFVSRTMLCLNDKLLSVADWLGRRTMMYSARKKKIMLVLFCSAFVSESSYVIWNSFQSDTPVSYSVTAIRYMPLLKEGKATARIAIPELERIRHFKTYLDSLSRSESGRTRRDSFLAHRPHLMDTLLYLETLYSEKFKTESNGKK